MLQPSYADRDMIKANVTPEAIVAVAQSGVLTGVDEELVAQLKPSHIAVTCSLLHYGKDEHNPLDEVTFYSKKKPNDYSDISLLMPSSFAEVWLRIYTKDGAFHGSIQAAYRRILKGLVSAEPLAYSVASTEEETHGDGSDPDVLGGSVAAATASEGSPIGAGEDTDVDIDVPPIKLWKPGSPLLRDAPSTPRTMARNMSTNSIGVGGPGRTKPGSRTASFSENQFTAVPPNFRAESPTRRPRSKRRRDVSNNLEGGRLRKSARLAGDSKDEEVSS